MEDCTSGLVTLWKILVDKRDEVSGEWKENLA